MAAKSRSSSFNTWFRAQHGPRCLDFVEKTDQQLEELVGLMFRGQAELARRRIYDARQTSAHYAWNARTPKKTVRRPKK